MFDALRDDCDRVNLAGSAELRGLGDRRRTNAHWAAGGVAALVVVAGVASGVALHRPGSSPTAQIGAAPANTSTACDSPKNAACVMITFTPSAAPATTHGPSTPSSHTSVSPPTSATSGACLIADFDVAHATIQSDDASGITGYDVIVNYTGAKTCKLSQAATLSYLDGSGNRQVIPLSSSAAPIMVKPNHSVITSVFGPNDQAVNPPPAACAHPHVYAGLDVRIDGRQRSLGSRTVTLPCGEVPRGWNSSTRNQMSAPARMSPIMA